MAPKSLTHREILARVQKLANHIRVTYASLGDTIRLCPVGAGGVPVVYALVGLYEEFTVEDSAEAADLLITDRERGVGWMRVLHPDKPLLALVYEEERFPWDLSDRGLVTEMLDRIGDNPAREGLLETPARVVAAWRHWFSGYGRDPAEVLKVFEDGAEGVDELVLVTNIPVQSMCEHHMAPIFGLAHVGYIPNRKIVGLSKLSRVVEVFARRLQVQERLTNQIATALWEGLDPQGVGVVLQCRHLCLESRGIQQQGTITTTSALRGAIKDKPAARSEFLQLIEAGRNGSVI